ncbi:MAG: S1 RNA-binding domain-containing protein [Chloroflexi bacterium]|nr:S1 RNA-binding domain-containing protein [Chloroflexota bacterium]
MDSNKPGSREAEELEAGASENAVDESNRPESAEASTTADESSVAQPDMTGAVPDESSSAEPPEDISIPATEAAEMSSAAGEEGGTPPAAAEGKAAADASGDLRTGMVVQGLIVSTSPTQVVIEVEGRQGVIPSGELERMTRQTLESLKAGENIAVYVVKPRDHNGNLLLSINRAIEEQDWQLAEDYRRSQDVYESRVAGYNKGGLIVRFGRLRGFVPQSQIAVERRAGISGETPEEQLGAMVNQPIIVKVMEVDRARNRLILSERAASRESREKRKENLISQLRAGEIREGRVVSLEDFGVFVDIGGAEGLVHLTELSYQHVTHPREIVQVGQTVRVEVISIDPDQKRIGLSMKQLEADPWDRIATSFTEGQLVQGAVTKLTKFGAFAQLVDLPEIEGLIHISELSDKRVAHPREVVNEGDKLTLRVVKIDIKNRRLGLSLKRVNSAEYLDLDWSSTNDQS